MDLLFISYDLIIETKMNIQELNKKYECAIDELTAYFDKINFKIKDDNGKTIYHKNMPDKESDILMKKCLYLFREKRRLIKKIAFDILDESTEYGKDIRKLSEKEECLSAYKDCERYTIFVTDEEWNYVEKYREEFESLSSRYDICTSNIPGRGPCKCCGGFDRDIDR